MIALSRTVPRPRVVQAAQQASVEWGYFPYLTLLGALSLLLVAVADVGARNAQPWSVPLFWSSLVLFVVPFALRLLSASATRQERVALVILLSLGLYMVKLMHSPVSFTFPDEFMHWRTINNMLISGKQFDTNPLLPISPLYPGLENATHAVVSLSGLSIFDAGVLMLGVARVVMAVALYLLYELACRSPRVASLAVLIYMANPNFVFFNSQYAYETLSIPLAAVVFCAVAFRDRDLSSNRVGLTVATLLSLMAVLLTHHLTTYAMIGFLAAWTVVGRIFKQLYKRKHYALGPGGLALLATISTMAWSAYIAGRTVGYLAPHFAGAFMELFRLISGEAAGRTLFKASSGAVAPLWERLAGVGSVGLLMLVLPFGMWRIWCCYRHNLLALVMGLGALSYPATLALRMTNQGAEISNRASEFAFVPLGFAIAAVADWCWSGREGRQAGRFGLPFRWMAARVAALPPLMRRALSMTWWMGVPVYVAVVFVGSTIVGWAPWARLPGPYQASSDTRSIEPQGIEAAYWFLDELGANNRIGVDRANRLMMASYGMQRPVTSYGDELKVSVVYFAPEIRPKEIDLLKRGRVRYLVVDRRLANNLPLASSYFERGDIGSPPRRFDLAELEKFDQLRNVQRVFDSGDIAIYDVSGLYAGPGPYVPVKQEAMRLP